MSTHICRAVPSAYQLEVRASFDPVQFMADFNSSVFGTALGLMVVSFFLHILQICLFASMRATPRLYMILDVTRLLLWSIITALGISYLVTHNLHKVALSLVIFVWFYYIGSLSFCLFIWNRYRGLESDWSRATDMIVSRKEDMELGGDDPPPAYRLVQTMSDRPLLQDYTEV